MLWRVRKGRRREATGNERVSDVERLFGWFASGELLRPDAIKPNIVDLAAVTGRLAGASRERQLTSGQSAIYEHIGEAEHIVFVLVDGFGTNLLERLPQNSFFRRHLAMELRTVFPSSTAPCLTSVATGLWPAQHGVPGWFMYLEQRQRSILVLPFVERTTDVDARTVGIPSEEVFQTAALTASFSRAKHWVMPRQLVGSVFTTYSCGGAEQVPYVTLDLAVERIKRIVSEVGEPSYTYWYIPDVDYVEHVRGASHAEVTRTLARVESAVEALAERLKGSARIVVTADHGQIDIPDEQRHVLEPGDPLMRHLLGPPSCEPRVPAFHVRAAMRAEFAAEFCARFGATWALLTVDEVDGLRLFGPDPLSSLTRNRLGDFVALNATHEIIMTPSKSEPLLGSHGGLLPDEMQVPLIVA